jgi:DHA3 family macrolide efflux protein-like MFS transporter
MMLFGSLISSTVPIGLLIAGPVADAIGIRAWFIATGILTTVMAVAGFFVPVLLGIEDGRTADPTAPDLVEITESLPI